MVYANIVTILQPISTLLHRAKAYWPSTPSVIILLHCSAPGRISRETVWQMMANADERFVKHVLFLELKLMWRFCVNLRRDVDCFLRKRGICPLIPFFGTIYAALVFQEAYMVVQALSLISMAQRAAKVPAASSEP